MNKLMISIVVLIQVLLPFYSLSQSANSIQLNQTGFYPAAPKIAVVTTAVSSSKFYITSIDGKNIFFTGNLSDEKQSKNSSIKTRVADFSAFTKKGKYIVTIEGAGHSYPFDIKDDAGKSIAIASLKGFYYQRVSMPLEEKYAGKWHRPAGHPDTVVYIHSSAASATRPDSTIISSPGGWYDAGDYNKYIVNSGISMGTLLSAYEDFPAYFKKVNTNIPESKDAVPDILNESIYNLRWMLTMQDPADGGVYNKCTNASFDGMVMPGVTKAPRYVVQKGVAATLDFAAVMAQASRILKQFNKQLPGLADSCIKAAKLAWQWSLQHPAMEYNQNAMNKEHKPAIVTGGYGDRSFKDEWLWAGAELFLTTTDKQYYDTVAAHLSDNLLLPAWNNVAMLAYYSCLRFQQQLSSHTDALASMKQKVLAMADVYLSSKATNVFQTVMGQSRWEFIWGSNSVAANQGILLVQAYRLTKDKKYIDAALSNFDYIAGRNATGYCFVTGSGSKPTMFPHHRQSVADGIADPVPGLLAGGPNPGMQDRCKYEFAEPETAYSDTDCSYASNEIAINWNAPLVYLANAVEALKKEVGYVK
jgi:endoglucanase